MKISETDRGRKTLSDATESLRGRNNISVMILVDNMGRNNRHIAYRGGVPDEWRNKIMSLEMKLNPIHSKRLAGFLLMRGCRLVNVEKDSEDKFVFYFKDTKKTKEHIKVFFGNTKLNTSGAD